MAANREPVQLRVFGSTSCTRRDFQGVCIRVISRFAENGINFEFSGGKLWIFVLYGFTKIGNWLIG